MTHAFLWKLLCTLMKIFVCRQYQFLEVNSFLRAKLKENRELLGAHNAKDEYLAYF